MPKSRIITGEGASLGAETVVESTTPLAGGATFDSGVFPASILGHTQVQSEILSDTDGTIIFTFHPDSAGATTIRTLTVPYLASEEYRLFAAPVFGPFLRCRFVNSATPQTQFYFATKFLVSALSPQLLALNSFVSPTMIATVGRSVITGENPRGDYKNVAVDEENRLLATIAAPTASFGEVRVAEQTPIVQIDAVLGITEIEETFVDSSPGTGSATTDNGNFVCQTGTGLGGYAVIRSRRSVRYQPGQAMLFRGTAIFDEANATANSLQAFGAFNSTNGLFVGYDGTQFGVMHRTDGKHEIRTLTITNPANNSQTLTLTLNGVVYSIPVTSGSASHNAYEIELWMAANQTAWDSTQQNGTVVFFNLNAGPASGAYSVSSTGGFTGTFSQQAAGVANTETWVYQENFNHDKLDGTGPSGMVLDKTKGNVFQITVQYLGYGNCSMDVENPATGQFFPFHCFMFANARTEPTFQIPSFKVGWIAASLGSTTNLTVKGASGYGCVEGRVLSRNRPRATTNSRVNVSTTIVPILSIRVRGEFHGKTQLNEVIPKVGSATADGTKAVEIKVFLNPTLSGSPNWLNVDTDESIVQVDTNAAGFTDTGTEVISEITLNASVNLPFFEFLVDGLSPLYLQRGDVLTVAARVTSGSTQDVSASLTWIES